MGFIQKFIWENFGLNFIFQNRQKKKASQSHASMAVRCRALFPNTRQKRETLVSNCFGPEDMGLYTPYIPRAFADRSLIRIMVGDLIQSIIIARTISIQSSISIQSYIIYNIMHNLNLSNNLPFFNFLIFFLILVSPRFPDLPRE